MPIPELEQQAADAKLKAFCDKRCSAHLHDQVRLVINTDGMSITISEERPYFQDPSEWTNSPVAKFTYKKKERLWYLLWRDRNSKWHHFDPPATAKKIDALIELVDEDQTCIFWG